MGSQARKGRAALVAAYILFLAALWGVAAAWIWNERVLTLAAADRHLAQITAAVAEQTLGLLRLVKISLVGADSWISGHPGVDPASSPEFQGLANITRSISNGLVDIRMVTREGGLRYVGAGRNGTLADVRDREYFRAQQNASTRGLHLALPVKSRVTGKWGIPVSYPVSDPASAIGVVFGALELDDIARLHKAELPAPGGSIALIRTDGSFLARTPFDPAYMDKNVSGSDNFMKRMLTQDEGVLHSDGSQVDGVARIIGFNRLKEYPVVVVVTALPGEILAPWRRQCAIIVGTGLAVTALAAVLLARLLLALRQNERYQAELERQASYDALTGLMNRRAFLEAAGRELARARRAGRPLTALMLDLDHFKDVNDSLGHAAGDVVLRLLGALLPSVLRLNDLAGRVGGEEFCVLLPEVEAARAAEVAERLRKGFADGTEAAEGLARRVTLSVGVAELRGADEGLEALLCRADQALYRAKAAGRDRVELA